MWAECKTCEIAGSLLAGECGRNCAELTWDVFLGCETGVRSDSLVGKLCRANLDRAASIRRRGYDSVSNIYRFS